MFFFFSLKPSKELIFWIAKSISVNHYTRNYFAFHGIKKNCCTLNDSKLYDMITCFWILVNFSFNETRLKHHITQETAYQNWTQIVHRPTNSQKPPRKIFWKLNNILIHYTTTFIPICLKTPNVIQIKLHFAVTN